MADRMPTQEELNQMAEMAGVVQQLKKERERAAKEVKQIDAALAALNGTVRGKQAGTRKMSAAGRARIVAAQRARWAKMRRKGGQRQNVVSIRKKRTMSAGARKKIAAAQRARWAKVKAGKKTG
jgi:hypothetical protein